MDYAKYAHLENYLFGEVKNNFYRRTYLTPKEFFCIVIWKANRSKTKIKKRLLKLDTTLGKAIRKITNLIFKASNDEEKLKILLNEAKFRLPMATAILSVLYPDNFTIYDVRVRGQLKIRDFAGRKDQVKRYFLEFLPKVREMAGYKPLRSIDKYLWGKSFYEDLKKLLKE